MKNKFDNEVRTYSGLILIFTLIPLVLYFIFFFKNGVSTDTSNWSEFGDFIGGYGSLIIGAGNLYFLIKISYKISEIDEDRNNQNNKSEEKRNRQNKFDAVVPLLILKSNDDFINFTNIKIDIKNCGIGPAIIDYYKLTYKENEYNEFGDIINAICKENKSILQPEFKTTQLRKSRSAIPCNEEINLLDLSFKVDFKSLDEPLKSYIFIRDELCTVNIEISYKDLYDNHIKTLKHTENEQNLI
ncbi:hypothetical protein [Empedobacter brevis]|uniref:hypothetical protein n=1 Tax=Empedobacter brevis TaxID=247 RepID=UPI002899F28D|nr:hypothetical protein [Empedobacter brevis]